MTDWAAALTYYGVLSIFPALIALVSIVGLLADPAQPTETITDIVTSSARVGGRYARRAIEPITANRARPASLLIVGLAGAIWSASGYVGAFTRAANVVYETPEGRRSGSSSRCSCWSRWSMIAVRRSDPARCSCSPARSSSAVAGPLGIGATAQTIWNIAKWPVLLVILTLMFAVLFHATPNVKMRGFKWVSPGAAVAILVAIVASALFAFYVAQLRQLQQDLRRAGRRRGLPDLVLADRTGAAVRHRARRRDRADQSSRTACRGPRRRSSSTPAPRPSDSRPHDGVGTMDLTATIERVGPLAQALANDDALSRSRSARGHRLAARPACAQASDQGLRATASLPGGYRIRARGARRDSGRRGRAATRGAGQAATADCAGHDRRRRGGRCRRVASQPAIHGGGRDMSQQHRDSASDASTAELMRRLSEQTSDLVRGELDLAKAELAVRASGPGSGPDCSVAPASPACTPAAR